MESLFQAYVTVQGEATQQDAQSGLCFAIIIPVFNGQPYISETIHSALGQSWKNLQVIVVDDGSTDNTPELAQEIRDPRLQVLSQKNAGVMAARRAGFAASSADAVVFLDSDDRLRSDAIERYQRQLRAHPEAGLFYGDRILMDARGKVFGSPRGALLNPSPSGQVLQKLMKRNFISTPGQTCIRSVCLEQSEVLGMDIRRALDWVLYCEIAASREFIYIGPGPVVEYRMMGSSLARSLASTGEHATDIEAIEPAIRAIYALPGVTGHFRPEKLAHLRKITEGSACAWKGQELLRACQWQAARACFLKALFQSPGFDLRDFLCLGLTYLQVIPPGLRRYIGLA